MKPALLLSLLAFGTAVGGAVYLHAENADLRDRLAALETVTGTADAAGEGTAVDAPGLRGAAVRREVAELKGTADALMRRMESLESQTQARADAAPASGPMDAAALAARPAFTEAVREIVLDMAKDDVDFKARVGRGDRSKLKDEPFARVAETLKLDASQEAAMAKDLQEIQQELFSLLAEERDDGVVPMEMIAKAEGLKDGDPAKAQVFVKLFTMKIPGSEETYMQRAVKLTTGFRTKADRYLRAEQKEILNAVEIDWFSIKFD